MYLEPNEVLVFSWVLIQTLLARFSLHDALFPICRSPIIHLVCLPAVKPPTPPPPPPPPAQNKERKKVKDKRKKTAQALFLASLVSPLHQGEIRGSEWGLPLAVK